MSSGAPRVRVQWAHFPYPFPLFLWCSVDLARSPERGPGDAGIHKLSQTVTSSCPPFSLQGQVYPQVLQSATRLGLSSCKAAKGSIDFTREDRGGKASHVQDNIPWSGKHCTYLRGLSRVVYSIL